MAGCIINTGCRSSIEKALKNIADQVSFVNEAVQRFIELFPKKPTKVDKEYNENAVKIIEEMDRNNGQGWIEKILKAAGMKKAIAKRKE